MLSNYLVLQLEVMSQRRELHIFGLTNFNFLFSPKTNLGEISCHIEQYLVPINTGNTWHFFWNSLQEVGRRCRRGENCGNNCWKDLEGVRRVHQWEGGERCEKMFYSLPLYYISSSSAPLQHLLSHPAEYLLSTFSNAPPTLFQLRFHPAPQNSVRCDNMFAGIVCSLAVFVFAEGEV